MARSRNIKPSFFTNDLLAECDPLARILFAGLWTIADREGRLHDRPKKIKVEVLPYDQCDVDVLLWQLAGRGFIVRYSENNDRFIQIVAFSKHQNPHLKEAVSEIPGISDTSTILAPDLHHTSPALTLNPITLTLNPHPLTPIPQSDARVGRAKKNTGISLDDLSIDHISEWLMKKRVAGKYLTIDEQALLEKFKDYCRSTGKKYADYTAAFRNSFEWDNPPLKGNRNETASRNPAKPNKLERAESALSRGRAAYEAQLQREQGMAGPALPPARPVIPDFQRVRPGAGSIGSDLPSLCEDLEPIPD